MVVERTYRCHLVFRGAEEESNEGQMTIGFTVAKTQAQRNNVILAPEHPWRHAQANFGKSKGGVRRAAHRLFRMVILGGLNAAPKRALKFGPTPESESGEAQLLTDNS
jgi:hypothetical protein